MGLEVHELDTLIDDTLDWINEITDDNDPDDQALLGYLQQVFKAINELRAWRELHPDEQITRVYMTEFGPTGVQ